MIRRQQHDERQRELEGRRQSESGGAERDGWGYAADKIFHGGGPTSHHSRQEEHESGVGPIDGTGSRGGGGDAAADAISGDGLTDEERKEKERRRGLAADRKARRKVYSDSD